MVYSGSVAYVVRRSKQCMCMACNVVVELMMIHGNKPLNFEILVLMFFLMTMCAEFKLSVLGFSARESSVWFLVLY